MARLPQSQHLRKVYPTPLSLSFLGKRKPREAAVSLPGLLAEVLKGLL